MTTTRKQHSPALKARLAIEVIRGEKTLSQPGSQFEGYPIQIAKWRKSAIEQLPKLFVDGQARKGTSVETGNDTVYDEIGRFKVELDWLKRLGRSIEDLRELVDSGHATSAFGSNANY